VDRAALLAAALGLAAFVAWARLKKVPIAPKS